MVINHCLILGHSSKEPKNQVVWSRLYLRNGFRCIESVSVGCQRFHCPIRHFSLQMIQKGISIKTVILLYCLFLAKSKSMIELDFDVQFDTPNDDHTRRSKIARNKLRGRYSSVNQNLVSSNGITQILPRYEGPKSKSRSLKGWFKYESNDI